MIVDLAYVGNRADDLLLFANFNQAAPNNSAGTIPLQARRPIPEFADITYSFNGGKSRYHAFQAKFDWRMRAGLSVLSSLTLSQTEGQRRRARSRTRTATSRRRRTSTTSTPTSGSRRITSRTTARRASCWDLPFGRGRRSCRRAAVVDALLGGWQIAGINTRLRGRDGDVHLHAAAGVPGLRHPAGLPRRQQLPARTSIGDPLMPEDERTPQNYFNRNNVVMPTDPSQPFGNAPRNSVRGPLFWQIDFMAGKRFPMPWRVGHRRVPRRGVQSAQPDELPRAERQPQRRRLRHDHDDLRSAAAADRGQGLVLRGRAVDRMVA